MTVNIENIVRAELQKEYNPHYAVNSLGATLASFVESITYSLRIDFTKMLVRENPEKSDVITISTSEQNHSPTSTPTPSWEDAILNGMNNNE